MQKPVVSSLMQTYANGLPAIQELLVKKEGILEEIPKLADGSLADDLADDLPDEILIDKITAWYGVAQKAARNYAVLKQEAEGYSQDGSVIEQGIQQYVAKVQPEFEERAGVVSALERGIKQYLITQKRKFKHLAQDCFRSQGTDRDLYYHRILDLAKEYSSLAESLDEVVSTQPDFLPRVRRSIDRFIVDYALMDTIYAEAGEVSSLKKSYEETTIPTERLAMKQGLKEAYDSLKDAQKQISRTLFWRHFWKYYPAAVWGLRKVDVLVELGELVEGMGFEVTSQRYSPGLTKGGAPDKQLPKMSEKSAQVSSAKPEQPPSISAKQANAPFSEPAVSANPPLLVSPLIPSEEASGPKLTLHECTLLALRH